MSVSLSALGVKVILLDVEGTTTPMAFVYDVLFPYARAHVAEFLKQHGGAAGPAHRAVNRLAEEIKEDQLRGDKPPALLLDYVHWLMDRDRKSTGLKLLQGLVWQEGFRTGQLRGEVYTDVPAALQRWHSSGLRTAIYSSGSVLAQRLLFGSTDAGDLTAYLRAYFDTEIGPKQAPESYHRIAEQVHTSPDTILFVSDVEGELDAARQAGVNTALCVRGDALPESRSHQVIRTFDGIVD